MKYINPYKKQHQDISPINEEIFGMTKAIKRGIGTYRDSVYVYILKNEETYIQNDWVVASSVNKKLMEMMEQRFSMEQEGNSWKIQNSDISKIESFLESLGLTSKTHQEGEGQRTLFRGRLSMKDLKEYETLTK